MFKIIRHFRYQRFIRHQNHGVDDIEQQIGEQVIPESHIANPHDGVAKHAGDAEQNKELTSAKAFAEPRGPKVIGQKAHQRADHRIQHSRRGKNQCCFNRGKAAEGGVEVEEPGRGQRGGPGAEEVARAIGQIIN